MPERIARAARMRTTILAMTASVVAVMPAHAEDRIPLPEIVVGAPTTRPRQAPTPTQAPASAGHERCVDVKIGEEHSLGCLNEKLKRQVDGVNPVLNTPPIDAKSQDLKVGIVNVPAVQQQYGQNFGHSVIPYRPAPPVFTLPLGRR